MFDYSSKRSFEVSFCFKEVNLIYEYSSRRSHGYTIVVEGGHLDVLL